MRFAVLTAGSCGDVEPYVALAAGLRRDGHEVCLATHEGFRDLAARHDLDLVPVPQPNAALIRSPQWRRWQRSGEGVARFVRGFARASRAGRPVIDGMLDAFWSACAGVDAVVSSGSGIGSPQLADARGARHCWALLQPMSPTHAFPHFLSPPSLRLPAALNGTTYRLAEQVHWRVFRAPLDDWLARRLGARPSRGPDPRGFLGSDPELVIYGISPLVLPRPPDWGPAIELCGYWFADAPPSWMPPPALTRFLADGAAPVYVHLSRMWAESRADLLRTTLGALNRLRLRGLLHTGMERLDMDLPGNVLAVPSAPHAWLLPRTAAVVHHGGAGTTAAALRAGVPSLGVPGFFDQPYWSRRIRALGVAPDPVPAARLDTDRLASALLQLTSDADMRRAASELGGALRRETGVRTAVDRLEHHLDGSPSVASTLRAPHGRRDGP